MWCDGRGRRTKDERRTTNDHRPSGEEYSPPVFRLQQPLTAEWGPESMFLEHGLSKE